MEIKNLKDDRPMIKKKVLILFLTLIMFLTVACGNKDSQTLESNNNAERIQVYASIYPMYDFAKKIGKDKIDLELMVPPGAEPHDWEPTAKLMAGLENAEVLIYNGADMEMWIDKVTGSIANKDLLRVEASEGIELIEFKEEDHDHEEEHHEEEHGIYDPHIWLDPIRAMKQAENIKNALIQADEKNKDFYEKNYNEFADNLEKLDQKYQKELKDRKSNKIVVAHAAFGYLADRYGLEQISISGLTPQAEPSSGKMARISELVNREKIKYIFFEALTSPRLAEVLAEETGAQTAVLNPIGGLTADDIETGKDYISVMEENLTSLKKAIE